MFFSCWFSDYAHHALLQSLTLQEQPIFVPDKVRAFKVESVPLLATFEQINDVFVIWIGDESKSTTVVHKLLELGRLIEAKLIDSDFLLLALYVIIFLVL